jgi:hypothetical protein
MPMLAASIDVGGERAMQSLLGRLALEGFGH